VDDETFVVRVVLTPARSGPPLPASLARDVLKSLRIAREKMRVLGGGGCGGEGDGDGEEEGEEEEEEEEEVLSAEMEFMEFWLQEEEEEEEELLEADMEDDMFD